jgi:hypothetical protein
MRDATTLSTTEDTGDTEGNLRLSGLGVFVPSWRVCDFLSGEAFAA